MKKQANQGKRGALRACSKARRREPQPYLSRRPGLRGRLLRLRAWLAAA